MTYFGDEKEKSREHVTVVGSDLRLKKEGELIDVGEEEPVPICTN